MSQVKKIAILGGGSFGTAIANIIAANDKQVYLWVRDPEQAKNCRETRENRRYLPGCSLHENLTPTADLKKAVSESDLIFIAIPSSAFRTVVRQLSPHLIPGTTLVSTTKGIEPEGFTLMSQILEQELGDIPVGVLSGPNFAKEIAQKKQTGTVIASSHQAVIDKVQSVLCSDTFRVYSNHDSYGVELGGALKNIYGIVCGMAASSGSGLNTQAMLLTRSLAEMGRFAAHLGADPMTFLGLSGVGDLILTCTSDLSRNYRVGYALGKGKSLEEAVNEIGQVVEGVNTVRLVKHKADELGVYMPLASALYSILFEQCDISDVARSLMAGEQNSDVEYMRKH